MSFVKKIVFGTSALCFVFLSFTVSVEATVGGPDLIEAFRYDSENAYIYYWKGGEHVEYLYRVDVDKKEHEKVCEAWEFGDCYMDDVIVDTEYVSNFPHISRIDLGKNDIDIEVDIRESHDPDYRSAPWGFGHTRVPYTAVIKQNEEVLKTHHFYGCLSQEEFVFEGYYVPEVGKLVVRLSNMRSCFETGYISESAFLVSGAVIEDITALPERDFWDPEHQWLGGNVVPTDGSIHLSLNTEDEFVVDYFREMSGEAYEEGDIEASFHYLKALRIFFDFSDLEAQPDVYFEMAALLAGYSDVFSSLQEVEDVVEELFTQVGVDDREYYAQKIKNDERFSDVLGEPEFMEVINKYVDTRVDEDEVEEEESGVFSWLFYSTLGAVVLSLAIVSFVYYHKRKNDNAELVIND